MVSNLVLTSAYELEISIARGMGTHVSVHSEPLTRTLFGTHAF